MELIGSKLQDRGVCLAALRLVQIHHLDAALWRSAAPGVSDVPTLLARLTEQARDAETSGLQIVPFVLDISRSANR